jgi:hypothetical protein
LVLQAAVAVGQAEPLALGTTLELGAAAGAVAAVFIRAATVVAAEVGAARAAAAVDPACLVGWAAVTVGETEPLTLAAAFEIVVDA